MSGDELLVCRKLVSLFMHEIRLRYPWQRFEVSEQDLAISVNVPDDAVQSAELSLRNRQAHSVTYERRFNCPTGLTESEKVYLRMEHWTGSLARLALNGSDLTRPPGGKSSGEIWLDVTPHLTLHNRLELVLLPCTAECSEECFPRLSGNVSLVILNQSETIPSHVTSASERSDP
jgi:hypothetical protein